MKLVEDAVDPKTIQVQELFDNPTADWNSAGDDLIAIAQANPDKSYIICDDKSVANLPSFLRLLNREDSPNIKAEQHLYNSMSEENFYNLYEKLDLGKLYKALENNTNPEDNKYASDHIIQLSRAINKASEGRFYGVEYSAGEKLFISHGKHRYEAMMCLHTNRVKDHKRGFFLGEDGSDRFFVNFTKHPITFHSTNAVEFNATGKVGGSIRYSALGSYWDLPATSNMAKQNDLILDKFLGVDANKDISASWFKVLKATATGGGALVLDIEAEETYINRFVASFAKGKQEDQYAHYTFKGADKVYGYPWPAN